MASPYDHRKDLEKQVNSLRMASGKPALYTDEIQPGLTTYRHNLQRAAQYRASRLQSGETAGYIPQDTRSDLDKARAAFYTGDKALCLIAPGYSPYDAAQLLDGSWHDALCSDQWNEFGVGVGGGPFGLIFVVFLGHRTGCPIPEGLVGQELPIPLPSDLEVYEPTTGLTGQFPF